MKTILNRLMMRGSGRNRRGGFIIITELMLIVTIIVIGVMIGLVTMRNTLNTEMEDLAHAIGGLNQSYAYAGIRNDNGSASTAGSLFTDAPDDNAHDEGVWVFVPSTTHEGVDP
jgi:hypothetical protein